MSKLHIVLACLNCLKLTRQTVDSIKTEHTYSIHIMDQESNKDFEDWANSRSNSKDFWHHRFAPRVSLSEAWNKGIQESIKDEECEYIFLPNNDVVFHKSTIDNLTKAIDRLGHAMVTGDNVQPRMDLDTMQKSDDWGNEEFDSRPIKSWLDEGPDFSCLMIKRDFPEKYGWFDENFKPAYCEDQCCHIRIIKAGGHAKRITKAPYYHHSSQTLIKNPTMAGTIGQGHVNNKYYYVKKWGCDHALALNGKAYDKPFNDDSKSLRWWDGCEKYHEFEKKHFGK